MKRGILVLLSLFLICSPTIYPSDAHAASKGKIQGTVVIPARIDLSTAPPEAKIFIYLKDYTPKASRAVLPWEAPTLDVIDLGIRSLKGHDVAFVFGDLPGGRYGVSVLIDTGRPHVLPGSRDFTAYPGDYAGGTRDDVVLDPGGPVEISIDDGLYVPIPDGYEAPVYPPR